MFAKRTLQGAALAAALALPACADEGGRLPTHPVTGKVLADGKPLANADVVFHPATPFGADAGNPRGKTGPDGTFRLTTYEGNDGAPAGGYRVTVSLWLAGKGDQPPANRLPAAYADPAKSRLVGEVAEGPNDVKPFELESR